jgi:glycosyltransferase involved in cell wall biosynthesis
MSDTFFSIIVAAYNTEKYIRECLESILGQTFYNYEVIIVDDGSTDGTGMICEEYAIRYDKIKVIHQENRGLLKARKTGLEAALGSYIIFVDSDDYISKSMLKEVYEIISKNKDIDMMLFGMKRFYDDEAIIERCDYNDIKKYHYTICEKDNLLDIMIDSTELNNIVTKVIKKDIIDLSIYDKFDRLSYAEDLYQSFNFIIKSNKIISINKEYYFYRIRKGSLTHVDSFEKFKDVYKVRKIFYNLLKSYGYLDEIKEKRFFFFLFKNTLNILFKSNIDKEKKFFCDEIKNIKRNKFFIKCTKFNLIKNRNILYKFMAFLILVGNDSFLYVSIKIIKKFINKRDKLRSKNNNTKKIIYF